MRTVFIGCTSFGKKCLELCLSASEVEVVGLITAPEEFNISYSKNKVRNVLHSELKALALHENIPFHEIDHTLEPLDLLRLIRSWKPEAFLVVGWYHLLPASWLELCPAYGLHASLLPKYAGGAPLVWAMINGERKTGITLFQMDSGVDTGPIVGQREVIISEHDTIGSLYSRVEIKGIELLTEYLPKIANKRSKVFKQDLRKQTVMPQRTPADGLIDWNYSAVYIERFIRAQTNPYPGAFTLFNGAPLHIWDASVFSTKKALEPGVLMFNNHQGYTVDCGSDQITLRNISYRDKLYVGTNMHSLFKREKHHFGY